MAAALGAVGATPAAGQRASLGGRVMRGGSDGPVAVADQWVVLHRVDQQGGAPLDSMRTGRDGRFRFRLTWDTTAIYFVGTEWLGIAYLTVPVQGREPADTVETLMVWDTTRTGAPLFIAQRHLIVRRPEPEAGRRVLELVNLQNRGTATRVGTGADGPTWSARLPAGAAQFQVGESDMSADAVQAVDGAVQVLAPVPPGERQLLYTYVLPADERTLDLVLDQPAGGLTILVEDTLATLERGALANQGVQVFEDATFRIFHGAIDGPGDIRIRFAAGGGFGEGTVAILALGAALGAGLLLLRFRRRPAPAAAAAATGDPRLLARQIAALDAAFEARTDPTAEERGHYERERARLREELDRRLRGAGSGG